MIRGKVLAQCEDCNGTGLYFGFSEPKGSAVICLQCKGTGCEVIKYKPFKKRRGIEGIKMVYKSRGDPMLGEKDYKGKGITYEEFTKGKMPH